MPSRGQKSKKSSFLKRLFKKIKRNKVFTAVIVGIVGNLAADYHQFHELVKRMEKCQSEVLSRLDKLLEYTADLDAENWDIIRGDFDHFVRADSIYHKTVNTINTLKRCCNTKNAFTWSFYVQNFWTAKSDVERYNRLFVRQTIIGIDSLTHNIEALDKIYTGWFNANRNNSREIAIRRIRLKFSDFKITLGDIRVIVKPSDDNRQSTIEGSEGLFKELNSQLRPRTLFCAANFAIDPSSAKGVSNLQVPTYGQIDHFNWYQPHTKSTSQVLIETRNLERTIETSKEPTSTFENYTSIPKNEPGVKRGISKINDSLPAQSNHLNWVTVLNEPSSLSSVLTHNHEKVIETSDKIEFTLEISTNEPLFPDQHVVASGSSEYLKSKLDELDKSIEDTERRLLDIKREEIDARFNLWEYYLVESTKLQTQLVYLNSKLQ